MQTSNIHIKAYKHPKIAESILFEFLWIDLLRALVHYVLFVRQQLALPYFIYSCWRYLLSCTFVFVYADQRGRTGPQAGSAATPLCWHQVQVRSLLTLQVRPLPVDDRSECWSASRKISCAQGPCQLQCRFQLLITYVAVIWVSIAYLYSLRVLNCMTSTEDTSLWFWFWLLWYCNAYFCYWSHMLLWFGFQLRA
jgi:hypothetical protein